MNERKKAIGILGEKKEGNGFTDVKIGDTRIRCWATIKPYGKAAVENPAINELNGVRVGNTVEADYDVVEKYDEVKKVNKTYFNLVSICIRTDNPAPTETTTTAPTGKPEKKSYGKSPEEQASILIQSTLRTWADVWTKLLEPMPLNVVEADGFAERVEHLIWGSVDRSLDNILIRMSEVKP